MERMKDRLRNALLFGVKITTWIFFFILLLVAVKWSELFNLNLSCSSKQSFISCQAVRVERSCSVITLLTADSLMFQRTCLTCLTCLTCFRERVQRVGAHPPGQTPARRGQHVQGRDPQVRHVHYLHCTCTCRHFYVFNVYVSHVTHWWDTWDVHFLHFTCTHFYVYNGYVRHVTHRKTTLQFCLRHLHFSLYVLSENFP